MRQGLIALGISALLGGCAGTHHVARATQTVPTDTWQIEVTDPVDGELLVFATYDIREDHGWISPLPLVPGTTKRFEVKTLRGTKPAFFVRVERPNAVCGKRDDYCGGVRIWTNDERILGQELYEVRVAIRADVANPVKGDRLNCDDGRGKRLVAIAPRTMSSCEFTDIMSK